MHRLQTPSDSPKEFRLQDYKVPDHLVKHTELHIDLTKQPVRVKSRLTIEANPECKIRPKNLVLDGKELQLKSIHLDFKELNQKEYRVSERSLTVYNVPETFTLETEVDVADSKDLFGLYTTEGVYLVKAETEGLRKVFFCKDRPDVLSTYKTTIVADPNKYPVVLCNGKITKTENSKGSSIVVWEDDQPKPTYLFALAAGTFETLKDEFKTQSGKKVGIEFYVKKEAREKCFFAMAMLKQAMTWDQTTYGLECELDAHRVACIDKYAAGASEPTGLNLFNSQYLFATAAMKNDDGYLQVADVISHEYFHYLTGNLVTIRDWFNLTLKEGLTCFRTEEFLEHVFGKDVARSQSVKHFLKNDTEEDAARPDFYGDVRNLYNDSAYVKGSEIFRMMCHVLGKEVFHNGVAKFVNDNRGKAVNLETFLESMQQTTGKNLSQFLLWFTQTGTPVVEIKEEYNAEAQTYTLKVKQFQPNKSFKAVPIPITLGLLDAKGQEMSLRLEEAKRSSKETTLIADKEYQEFKFVGITSKPVPSLLRDFSAPILLLYDYDIQQVQHLMQYDTNVINRWQATQKYMVRLVTDCCAGECKEVPQAFIDVLRGFLKDKTINPWIVADMITLPSETELGAELPNVDLECVGHARKWLSLKIAIHLQPEFKQKYEELTSRLEAKEKASDLDFDIQAASDRRLRNQCLKYQAEFDPQNGIKLAMAQFTKSLQTNMTDTMAALEVLANIDCAERNRALDMFYQQWSNDTNAINYWFRIQASVYSQQTVSNVKMLMKHQAFDMKNPNKIFALFRPFIKNPAGFHAASGEGYQLLAAVILELEKFDTQTAATLARNFVEWETCDEIRLPLMRKELYRVVESASSSAVKEVLRSAFQKAKAREAAEQIYTTDVPLLKHEINGVRFWEEQAVKYAGTKRDLETVFKTQQEQLRFKGVK